MLWGSSILKKLYSNWTSDKVFFSVGVNLEWAARTLVSIPPCLAKDKYFPNLNHLRTCFDHEERIFDL